MNGYGRGEEQQNKKGSAIVTRETFGMTLLFFSVILLVFAIAGPYILGDIGVAITGFLHGVFGFFVYPFFLLCIYGSIVLVSGKKFLRSVNVLRILAVAVCAFLIAHLATSVRFSGAGYGAYLNGCWTAAESTAATSTAGGALFGLIVYPVLTALSLPGAYVVFTVLTLAAVAFLLWGTPAKKLFTRTQAEEQPKLAAKQEDFEREEPRPIRKVETFESGSSYPKYNQESDTEDRRPPLDDNLGREFSMQKTAPVMQREPVEVQKQQPMQPMQAEQLLKQDLQERAARQNQPQAKADEPVSGKDILFSSDPARSYYGNLAYNGDGYFRSHVRKSSMQPVAAGFAQVQEPTYSEGYRTQAEQPQRYVERQIVEQKPDLRDDGYRLNPDDLNYTATPSYRQPTEEPKE